MKKKNKNNAKTINGGLSLLFLVGCLTVLLVGGYSLMVIYGNREKDDNIISNQMQINSNNSNVSVAEDGATATVVK